MQIHGNYEQEIDNRRLLKGLNCRYSSNSFRINETNYCNIFGFNDDRITYIPNVHFIKLKKKN